MDRKKYIYKMAYIKTENENWRRIAEDY